MKKIFYFLFSFFLGQQAIALSCSPSPSNPFKDASSVFLVEVIEPSEEFGVENSEKFAPQTTHATIRVLKVYKGDVQKVNKINIISSNRWLQQGLDFVQGDLYLLYNDAYIGKCEGYVRPKTFKDIEIFETKHRPIWTLLEK